ncbi:MAG TPA: GspE/PulE family protein [Calditrichia bacterium]|nr:type II/IV secretion system protein [Calditrichota bacterium]HQV30682.1 GspE/PulE family protein [Calditrichia bacterium]
MVANEEPGWGRGGREVPADGKDGQLPGPEKETWIDRIPADLAWQERICPMKIGEEWVLACDANHDPPHRLYSQLCFLLGQGFRWNPVSGARLEALLRSAYAPLQQDTPQHPHSFSVVDEGDGYLAQKGAHPVDGDLIVRQVNHLISEAVNRRASDIHLECDDGRFRLRYRIDGFLREQSDLPWEWREAILSRLKIMAGLDIAEKRRPQDGRIRMRSHPGSSVDLRVSTMPTHMGEKAVLRILDRGTLSLSLDNLGFSQPALKALKQVLRMPHGMLLVTGPTGSGKTTTLYAALSEINQNHRNIVTIEDPIEYHLSGINQTAARPEIGLDFTTLLRTVLRQDPDVIMVGEIRDPETAGMAVRAALTGHLVLSTLHTNNAASAIMRLLDMSIEPFLVAGSLRMVLAQRLVRRLCRECRISRPPSEKLLQVYDLPETLCSATFFVGRGCPSCGGTGYRGRLALFEQLPVTEDLSRLLTVPSALNGFYDSAGRVQLATMAEQGLAAALSGETSLAEILRVTGVPENLGNHHNSPEDSRL